MPILEDQTQFGAPLRAGTGTVTQEPKSWTGSELVKAVAQNENEVGAGIMHLLREREFEPVEGYSVFSDPEFKESRHVQMYGDEAIGVRSPAEWRARVRDIERLEKNDELIESAGIFGTVAAMGAGFLSPTTLIPGGTVYKVGKLGYRVARTAGSVGAAAMGGTALQELGLQTFNETRTMGDSAAAIAGAGAFGGVLGGALGARRVAPGAPVRPAPDGGPDIEPEPTHFSPLTGGGRVSAGAAAVEDLDTTLKQGWGGATLSRLTAFMTPLTRMQNAPVGASRMAVAQLADPGGVRVVANTADGGHQAMVPGGSVEMRVKVMQDSILANYYRETDQVYAEYWKAVTGGEGVQGKIGMASNAARKALGGVDGPMSPTEFANAVGQAIRVNDAVDADPFIQKAATVFKKHIAEVQQHAVRAGVAEPITKGPKFAGGYVPRIFNSRAVAARATDIEEVTFRSMKADQERKALLQKQAADASYTLEGADLLRKTFEGRKATNERRIADVESRLAEVSAATKRGESRLGTADQRVFEVEQEIEGLEKELADAKATKDYDAADLKAMEKELAVLRKARDKALKDAAKGAPEAPTSYDRLPDGTLPEGFNAGRFLGYLTGDRAAPKEPSFIRWLIKNGGVRDDGGDVAAAFGGEPPRGLIRPNGSDLDTVAQRYAEEIGIENYKPNAPGNRFEPNDMLQFIADAERGTNPPDWERTYPPELTRRLSEYRTSQEVAQAMRDQGLDPGNKQQAIAYLRGESAEGLVGKPMTEDDLIEMGDIPLDPVEGFRRADDVAGATVMFVKESERIVKALRSKIAARQKTEAKSLGRQGEAVVNAKAARSRMDVLLDRAEFYAARDAKLNSELDRLTKQTGDIRAMFEKIIDEWDGETTKSAKSAIERRAEQEALRQEAIAAGTYKGRGGRLASADAEVDSAIKRIVKSDRAKIDAELRTQARDVVMNLLATPEGRLPYEWGETASKESRAMAASTAPGEEKSRFLKERKFPVQDAEILDILENDVRTVMHAYTHSMIPQAEMARMFEGDVQGTAAVRAIKEEYAELIRNAEPLPRSIRHPFGMTVEQVRGRLTKQMDADIKDFHAMRDRILGVYALPNDPDSLFHRGAMIARQWNYLSKMGSMVLSQVADTGMQVMRNGFGGTFDALGGSLNRLSDDPALKNLSKMEMRFLEDASIGTEMVLGNRALSFAEIATDYGRASKFERGTRAATAAMSFLNLSRKWDNEMQIIAGIANLRRMMRGVEEWATKGATEDAEWLAQLNIGRDQAQRIWKAAEAGEGERVSGALIPEGRTWDDLEAYEMARVALRQAVDSTVIKAGQDKALVMSTPTGAVIGQFKTFIVAAQQRIVVAGLQQADANVLSGAASMLALGALTVTLRDLVRDGQVKKRTGGELLVEAFDNSGLGGWMMEPNNVAEKISGHRFGLRPALDQKPANKNASKSRADALLGPSFGFLSDVTRVTGAALSGEMTHGDVQALRNQVPTQNLIWIRPGVNKMQSSIEDALGIEQPKKRAAQ